MTKTLKRGVKRGVAVIAIAAAISTLAPAASSFFVFSSDFRLQAPARGGESLVHKNGPMPGWIAEIVTNPPAQERSVAGETQTKLQAAPI